MHQKYCNIIWKEIKNELGHPERDVKIKTVGKTAKY